MTKTQYKIAFAFAQSEPTEGDVDARLRWESMRHRIALAIFGEGDKAEKFLEKANYGHYAWLQKKVA